MAGREEVVWVEAKGGAERAVAMVAEVPAEALGEGWKVVAREAEVKGVGKAVGVMEGEEATEAVTWVEARAVVRGRR